MESNESDSFTSATSSDVLSPSSLPRPRIADRESLAEIRRKIETGEYLIKPNDGSRAKSTIWAKFQKVFAKSTDGFTGAVCCKECGEAKYYSGKGKEGKIEYFFTFMIGGK